MRYHIAESAKFRLAGRRLARGRTLPLAAAVLLALPCVCLGQVQDGDGEPFHDCTVNASGGWSLMQGSDRGNLTTGWKNFTVGAGFQFPFDPPPNRRWRTYFTFNFFFDELGITPQALTQARDLNLENVGLLEATSGGGKAYGVSFDPEYRFPRLGMGRASVGFYFFGGFGWFRRTVEFTGASTQGELIEPGNRVVYSTGANSGFVDAGAGVNLGAKRGGLMPYLEVRVVHGLAANSGTAIVPVSLGLRW